MMTRDERVGALFAAHAARLFAYARRYGPAELAEDLVSDAFVVAVRKIAANQRRREASYDKYWREAVRTYWAAGRTDSPETVVADRDECVEALTSLSESDRDLLLLVAWDGLEVHAAEGDRNRSEGGVVRTHVPDVRTRRARTTARSREQGQRSLPDR